MRDEAVALPLERLAHYLAAHLPGFAGQLTAEKFSGGQSNPTYRLDTPQRSYVLRRKPPGVLLPSAHQVEREYAVMRALEGSSVPTPRARLLCGDPAVIGSVFLVMDFVDGRIFWDPALPQLAPTDRAGVYGAMNAALAALHSVDPAAVGLSGYGRGGDYFARQLARWTRQYRASATEPDAVMDRLVAWLDRNLPADDGRVSLVHGDYRIDNMIFAADQPRLLALLDWELSTLGHPFADLAYQCMQWRLPNEGAFRGLAGIARGPETGLPTEASYVADYCRRMGLQDVPHWPFFLAFSFFRLAAILQGVVRRAADGNASNPERARQMAGAIPLLAGMAVDLVRA